MSKYRFYIDIYQGLDPKQFGLSANTNPPMKNTGSKRIAFDVTIPDELMFDVDGYAAEVTKPKIVD